MEAKSFTAVYQFFRDGTISIHRSLTSSEVKQREKAFHQAAINTVIASLALYIDRMAYANSFS